MATSSTRGLLLLNLGTPDAPTTGQVRRYLREFLSDARVIDIHPVARWLLLNGAILPVRPARSAYAYRQIWTAEGSPLLVHSREFAAKLARELEGEFEVELAMRYGKPSIQSALTRLRDKRITSLTALPLYPQYAAASTGSSLAKLYQLLTDSWDVLPVKTIPPFYSRVEFSTCFAEVARPVVEAHQADYVLFSFHGLPERQIQKSDATGFHCLSSVECCDQVGPANQNCYRAQAFFTARSMAQRLHLPAAGYSVSFQSRLGRTPWIRPYTDLLIPELAQRGVRRLVVICPSFVADCLETLEEIGIRARQSFKAAGGEELRLVPSLNSHPAWVRAVASIAREA